MHELELAAFFGAGFLVGYFWPFVWDGLAEIGAWMSQWM